MRIVLLAHFISSFWEFVSPYSCFPWTTCVEGVISEWRNLFQRNIPGYGKTKWTPKWYKCANGTRASPTFSTLHKKWKAIIKSKRYFSELFTYLLLIALNIPGSLYWYHVFAKPFYDSFTEQALSTQHINQTCAGKSWNSGSGLGG